MEEIEKILTEIHEITSKYKLEIFYIDFTDITLLARIGLTSEVFIQIYINIKKQKTNLALIVSGIRIYGVDKEGGFYHEHPFSHPELHQETKPIGIEEFVIKSLDYLKEMGLL